MHIFYIHIFYIHIFYIHMSTYTCLHAYCLHIHQFVVCIGILLPLRQKDPYFWHVPKLTLWNLKDHVQVGWNDDHLMCPDVGFLHVAFVKKFLFYMIWLLNQHIHILKKLWVSFFYISIIYTVFCLTICRILNCVLKPREFSSYFAFGLKAFWAGSR